jgi:serine/threonine protein kinase
MSPEQVRGLPIDARSDIFAVGTCMYEMLTSDRLFMGESDFSTLERVRNAEVAPIETVVRDLPPGLERSAAIPQTATRPRLTCRRRSRASSRANARRSVRASSPPG